MTFIDWLSGNIPNNKLDNYLYNTRHILVILATIAVVVLLALLFRNKSEKTKNRLFLVFGFIFLFFELASRVVNLVFLSDYTVLRVLKELLPLWFCSITVWLLMTAIFTKNKTLLNAVAIMGVLVTTVYLFYPAVGLNQKIIHFDAFYSIFSHCLGFICSYTLLTTKHVEFKLSNLWKTLLIFTGVYFYGVSMSLYVFNEDFLFALFNPLGFEMLFPYPALFIFFLIAFISLFYLVSTLTKAIKQQKDAKKEQKDTGK